MSLRLYSIESLTGPITANIPGAATTSLIEFQRNGVTKHRIRLEVTTNDLIFDNGTIEAFRVTQSTAYVQVGVRLGIAVSPSYPLHVVGASFLNGPVSIGGQGAPPTAGCLIFTTGTTVIPLQVTTASATATVPLMTLSYGATPGAGGYGLRIYKSDGTTDVFGITDKYSVVIGTAALVTTATDGFLYITSCAGTPTGVPTAFIGRIAMEYDTSANKIWFYNGSWRGILVA